MSNQNFKLNQKYRVKGFIKPVTLVSYRSSTGKAVVNNGKDLIQINIDDIIGPIVDSLLTLLGNWIKSFFKSK